MPGIPDTTAAISTPGGLLQFRLSLVYFQSRLCPTCCFQSRMDFANPDKAVFTLEAHNGDVFCGFPAQEGAGTLLVHGKAVNLWMLCIG